MASIYLSAIICLCSIVNILTGKCENREHLTLMENMVSVTQEGIRNDGTPIGGELNELVKQSYGKTLFFPAGTYTLSEPIVLPFDYTKNVHIIFDKNALLQSHVQLEALLKIGYSEMSTPDRSYRRFSYIEGGMFDCSNADNGILVNGLKQLVSLRSISLFKGRKTHIRVQVSDDFKGTGSADTKIDNITIQGISSNEEVYGIYIDKECADIKISNTFIYGTKYGITSLSSGHIFNNIHILSQVTTGGLNKGADNFKETEGIAIASNGFFILHEIYFDTIDKAIVIKGQSRPLLTIDKNIVYSYLDHFGSAFIFKDHAFTEAFEAKISNSIFHLRKDSFRVFDIHPGIIGKDRNEGFSFINNTLINPHHLSPYDPSLLQGMRNKESDIRMVGQSKSSDAEWYVLGSLSMSPFAKTLRIELAGAGAWEVYADFNGEKAELSYNQISGKKSDGLQLAYLIQDGYCVLVTKIPKGRSFQTLISEVRGKGSFMPTPSGDRPYLLRDYHIAQQPTVISNKK